jgi:protein import protein ZIM17
MRDRGQLVKKGTLSEDGDLEFWEDGTTTTREKKVESVAGTDGQKGLE